MYQIEFSPVAKKNLSKLDSHIQRRISTGITNLSQGLNSNCKKLQSIYPLYRLRVGDYRVIFKLDQGKLIICVIRIGHRKDVYKNEL